MDKQTFLLSSLNGSPLASSGAFVRVEKTMKLIRPAKYIKDASSGIPNAHLSPTADGMIML